MILRIAGVLAVSAVAVVGAGQPPVAVDFGRDVQPILREHCFSCHGPEMQMSGLRLDRRADAMRGSAQSVIGPGNAAGSRLFHRVAGTSLGPQMPPGTPLGSEQIDLIKQWIDEGAAWPDAISGDAPVRPADPSATHLMTTIRAADRAAIDRAVREEPRAAKASGPEGSTPLMAAALYGDATLVERLLRAGADPNAANAGGATALMWAVPDVEKMQRLLDAGADVNARSDERRTALTIASGIVGATPAVTLLLEYGADPTVRHATDPAPLREAVRADVVDTFRVLRDYGVSTAGLAPAFVRTNCAACAEAIAAGGRLPRLPPEPGAGATAPVYDPGRSALPTPVGPTPASPKAIRAAIERSLPLLQEVGVDFVRQTGCVSCHHNSLVSAAVAAARANGYAVNERTAAGHAQTIGAYLESWRERTVQNAFIAGQTDTISYLLYGLAADAYPPDAATDAQAIWLKRRQAADGHWSILTIRPPIESNDIEVTAISMRVLQVFAPPSQRAEYERAVDRARAWLARAAATTTEERALKLLGLSWAHAAPEDIKAAARDLLAAQRSDGGWAQAERMTSDAYATGEALVALRESGAADLTNRGYRSGLEFLLRTQFEDGSWFVESRAVAIQPYFDSGFPYGVNQWISAAATAWATQALALAR